MIKIFIFIILGPFFSVWSWNIPAERGKFLCLLDIVSLCLLAHTPSWHNNCERGYLNLEALAQGFATLTSCLLVCFFRCKLCVLNHQLREIWSDRCGLTEAKVHSDYCALPRDIDSNVACWVTQPTRKCFQENTARNTVTSQLWRKKPLELIAIHSVCRTERRVLSSQGIDLVMKTLWDLLFVARIDKTLKSTTDRCFHFCDWTKEYTLFFEVDIDWRSGWLTWNYVEGK